MKGVKVIFVPVVASLAMLAMSPALSSNNCQPIEVRLMNQSAKTVTIEGANVVGFDHELSVAPGQSRQAMLCKLPFYTTERRLMMRMGDAPVQAGLVKDGVSVVHLRVNKNGAIEQNGMHAAGFNLAEYVEWYGLKSVL